MEPEVLIVFVDSLPYALLPQMERMREAPQHWPLRPGFGYSVNIHAEMFAGLLPDEVGTSESGLGSAGLAGWATGAVPSLALVTLL